MPTTSNFGWTTPADTDLVKDGAAAIRTLGNGIDTSFLDLKGGTSGQVLSKASNTDLDFTWVAQDDSNAIQNAIVDAKGDLISATGADTPARLAVGANGTVLTADSAEATGLKWAAPAGSSFVGVSIIGNSNQTIANETATAVNFGGTDQYDTDAFHDPSSNNSRITIPSGKGGKYLVTGTIWWNDGTGQRFVSIYKNGTEILNNQMAQIAGISNKRLGVTFATVVSLAAADYIELYVLQGSGGNLSLLNDIYSVTHCQATLLGA